MKIFLIGGTGAIGRPALGALVGAGHEVHALVRTDAKAKSVVDVGAVAERASIYNRDELEAACVGCDAVVNLATAIPSTAKFMSAKAWANNQRVRTEGSAAIVDAALATGVPRLVQESVVMIYPDSADAWVDESVATDDFPIARGNLAAEANTARFTAAGNVGVVLRFGVFYGPGATHSEEAFALSRRHVGSQMGRSDTYISSVHMDDAASAVVAALDAAGGTYNVVDDIPVTKREAADAIAEASGKKTWVRGPGRSALLLGDRTTALTRSLRVSNEKFKTETGWAPMYPSVADGWRATAAVLLRM